VKCSSSVRQTPVFCFPSSHAPLTPPPPPPPPPAHIAHVWGQRVCAVTRHGPAEARRPYQRSIWRLRHHPPTVSQNAGLRSQTDNL
jgi:hypothetical protein